MTTKSVKTTKDIKKTSKNVQSGSKSAKKKHFSNKAKQNKKNSSEYNPLKRARNWAFTINNYTDNEISFCKELFDSERVLYIIGGFEVGKKGTPHIQGYLQMKNAVQWKSIIKWNKIWHIEPEISNFERNNMYCKGYEYKDNKYQLKDPKKGENKYFEYGAQKHQGLSRDLRCVYDKIKNGCSMKDIQEAFPNQYIKYSKGIKDLFYASQKDRTEKPYVEWIYGPTGVGKTKYASQLDIEYYIKDGTSWWDGYNHETVIIIDDFDGHWPFRDLLRLLDRYKYQGQIKGGYVKINSPKIIITCDRKPDDLYKNNKTDHELSQLLRRIDKITNLGTESNKSNKKHIDKNMKGSTNKNIDLKYLDNQINDDSDMSFDEDIEDSE